MTALTDALAEADKWFERGVTLMMDKRHPFIAAARLVADAPEWLRALLENPDAAELVSKCAVHGYPSRWPTALICHKGLATNRAEDCRMVRRLLVDPGDNT